jgi:hypothetical protein
MLTYFWEGYILYLTMNTEQVNNNSNHLTTVKTAYARIAMLLLAINFCLTGYVVYSMNQTVQTQIDAATERTSPPLVIKNLNEDN